MTSPSKNKESRSELPRRPGIRTVFQAVVVAVVVAVVAVVAAAAAAAAAVCAGSRMPLSLARSLSLALGGSGLVNTWTEYQRSCISLGPSQSAKLI